MPMRPGLRGVVARYDVDGVEVRQEFRPQVGELFAGLPGAVQRRLSGKFAVDSWGRDEDVDDIAHRLATVVLRVHIDSSELIPQHGPVVIVANRGIGFGELVALRTAIAQVVGRRPRFVGVPDVSVIGPAMRRLGGVAAHPAELGALLRNEELVLMPLSRQWRPGRAGRISAELLAPAMHRGATVLPAAVVGSESIGRWRVAIGSPLELPTGVRARTPLGAAELAERAQTGVQILLEDAFPARWALS